MRDEFPRNGVLPLQPNAAVDGQWNRLPLIEPDVQHLAASRIITWGDADPVGSAYHLTRTRLLHRMRSNGWRSLAVTAPTARCGKSVTSVNLAFSIARRSSMRSMLVDLDLMRPMVANYIGLPSSHSIASYLRDEALPEDTFARCAPNFAVATNNRLTESPQEVLQSVGTRQAVETLQQRFGLDILTFDLPPMLANDDALSFAQNVDCVLLVLEAGVTTAEQASFCEQELAQVTNVVGVVLNKCRFVPDIVHYY